MYVSCDVMVAFVRGTPCYVQIIYHYVNEITMKVFMITSPEISWLQYI